MGAKDKSVWNLIGRPLLISLVYTAFLALVKNNIINIGLIARALMAIGISYYHLVVGVCFFAFAVLCAKSAFLSKNFSKIVKAIIVVILFSAAEAIGSNLLVYGTDGLMPGSVFDYLLHFLLAAAGYILLSFIYSKELAESMVFWKAMDAVPVAKRGLDGTGTIIKGSLIGAVIAGPAGAVVGAIVGKNKADQKRK